MQQQQAAARRPNLACHAQEQVGRTVPARVVIPKAKQGQKRQSGPGCHTGSGWGLAAGPASGCAAPQGTSSGAPGSAPGTAAMRPIIQGRGANVAGVVLPSLYPLHSADASPRRRRRTASNPPSLGSFSVTAAAKPELRRVYEQQIEDAHNFLAYMTDPYTKAVLCPDYLKKYFQHSAMASANLSATADDTTSGDDDIGGGAAGEDVLNTSALDALDAQ